MKTAGRGFIIIFLLLINVISLRAQVNASFTVNYQGNNCNPATVSFTNTSTGAAPLSFEWNFGVTPGINSTLKDPSVTYLTCGTFNVVLKTTNGLSQVDYDTIPVTIYCSPKANLNVSPVTGCIPLNVQFTNTSVQGTGAINRFLWDFGDGNTSTDSDPNHKYTISGCKNVTVIITDVNGCTDDTTINNLVCMSAKPTASFSSSATSSCGAPFVVNYSSTSTGKIPLSYQWNFTGGSPSNSSLINPAVTYNASGNFDVQLVVTDSSGCTDTVRKANYASIAGHTADFTVSSVSGCTPLTTQVSGISSSAPLSWNWTVTPAASPPSSSDQNTSFVFNSTGDYQICLDITYPGGCIVGKCTTVTVYNHPDASFSVSGNVFTCRPPLTLNYTNTTAAAPGLTYKWLFPGGSPDTSLLQNPPPIIYSGCGSQSAMLIVNNGPSCTDTLTIPDVVSIDCPSSQFTALPNFGCAPLITQFISDGLTISPTFWQWNFGDTANPDSVQSTSPNPTHIFSDIGCYTIRLIIGNQVGCVDTLIDSNYVCVGTPPVADFSASPSVTCAHDEVIFTNKSTGLTGMTTYAWDFLDSPPFEVMSVDHNPVYHYPDTGWFNVTLITCNNGCCDTIRKDSIVNILPPIADVKIVRDCSNTLSVELHGTDSKGADSFLWQSSNGVVTSPSDSVTVITYPADGTYQASLIVHNNLTGCYDTAVVSIDIVSVTADFISSDTTVCLPHSVCFTNLSKNAVKYLWNVYNSKGDLLFSLGQRHPCINFSTADSFDIMLIATDANNCSDTIRKNKYIITYALNLSLAGNVTRGCTPLSVTFSSTATSSTSYLTSHLWNFGDSLSGTLDTSTLSNPTHVYSKPGFYSVTLISTDNYGCKDTLKLPQYIRAIKPRVAFSSDTVICLGQQSCFLNSTVGTNIAYQWNFGDNGTSLLAEPCHQYQSSGYFDVKLIGTDPGGCSDTLLKQKYIHVTQPQADFRPDSASSLCPPLKVVFQNLSTGVDSTVKYEWLFGDGSNSDVTNPVHIYNSPGYFDVTLILTTQSGCTDTIRYDSLIHISGASATYTVTPPSGCAPLNVCFIAHSGNVVKYTWDFGNGDVRTGPEDSVCYQYNHQGTFRPAVILDDGAGCVYSSPIDSVRVGGPVVRWFPGSKILCDSGTVQFRDSSISNIPIAGWRWTFSNNSGIIDSSLLQNPIRFYDTAGVYPVTLTLITDIGCIGSFTDTILITANPKILIHAPDSVCINSPIAFTDSVLNPTTVTAWTWNFGDPSSGADNISSLHSPYHSFRSAGVYSVSLIAYSSGGCGDTAQSTVTVLDDPTVNIQGSVTVCKGNSIQLNASGSDTYLWAPSDYLDNSDIANPVCTPLSTITYTVTGYNVLGCSAQSSVAVNLFLPEEKNISPDLKICRGSSAQLSATGGTEYSWFPSAGLSHSGVANPTAVPTVTTTYKVIIYDSICMTSDTLSTVITVSQLPVANAGPDGSILEGESYPIQATATDSIQWTPSATLSCVNCEDPVATPLETTVYTLTTINADGCRNSDEVIVSIICNGEVLYIPNIFSPNDNGKNDVFLVRNNGILKLQILRIYDRWGELIFETDSWDKGWDGTYKGKQLPPAVYVYYLKAFCNSGDMILRKGNITLVR